MPPTAIEIKARLDKAVDHEGNVLDMEAVLEIVTSLEKIVMTKESLEVTRIGKTINLMRKKTTNEDLSKRAKKLVKRWQTLVNNHIKKNSTQKLKTENLNGVVKRTELEQPPGSLNGKKTEASTEFESKLGSKRKGISPDIYSLKQNIKRTVSPRLTSSPKHGISSKLVHSPRLGVSPRQDISLKQGMSPKMKSRLDYSKSEPPSTIRHLALNSSVASVASEELKSELNCSGDFLNYSHHNNIQSELNKKHNESAAPQLVNPLEFFCNNGADKSAGTDATATDTRVQENRIILTDYISTITNNISPKETNLDTSETEINLSTTQNNEPIKEFTPIEPENLKVIRKELPEDITSPRCEADGVSGVYNTKNVWSPWDESVQQRDSDIILLPYVILD